MPADRPGDFNQAVMELGATLAFQRPSLQRVPGCLPLLGKFARTASELPLRRLRLPPRPIEVVCAVIHRGDVT